MDDLTAKARAAVQQAAAALPPQEGVKFTLQEGGAWGQRDDEPEKLGQKVGGRGCGMQREGSVVGCTVLYAVVFVGFFCVCLCFSWVCVPVSNSPCTPHVVPPPHPPLSFLHTQEVPRGHPDCLHGLTFVLSGVMESLRRPDAEALIKRHGGRVTSAVSGKTSFLVVGRGTGQSKFLQAKDKKTTLIDEDGLFSLIRASAPFVPPAPREEDVYMSSLGGAAGGAVAGGGGVVAAAVAGGGGRVNPTPTQGAGGQRQGGGGQHVAVAPVVAKPPVVSGDTQLWVEKFKPTSSHELVGNNSLIGVLRTWLQDWYGVWGVGGGGVLGWEWVWADVVMLVDAQEW